MELKLLQATFRFKDIHLAHSRKGAKEPTAPAASAEREINLNRPLFLEQAQSEVQETAIREYKEIEKSIHEITEMYKETVSVVRLQELLVDSIDGFIDDADTNVKSGKRNLAELNSKEQQNRKLIYKVFGFLYFIVFVYLVFLAWFSPTYSTAIYNFQHLYALSDSIWQKVNNNYVPHIWVAESIRNPIPRKRG